MNKIQRHYLKLWVKAVENDVKILSTLTTSIDLQIKSLNRVVKYDSILVDLKIRTQDMLDILYPVIGSKAENYIS